MGMANGERKKCKGSMKKCPLLLMSDFYHIAGKADDLLELYEEDTEMKKLLLAQILYFRGEVEKSSSLLNNIYEGALDFDAKVGLEMMRALCALHQGDIAAWQDVKQQMKAMLDHCADQREQLLFWTASIDSMIDHATAFPQWFKKGELNILPSFLMAFF